MSDSHVGCINWFHILGTQLDYIHFLKSYLSHTQAYKSVDISKAISQVHSEIIYFTDSEIIVNKLVFLKTVGF